MRRRKRQSWATSHSGAGKFVGCDPRRVPSALLKATMLDRFTVLLQHVLPKKHLTTFAGRVAGGQRGWVTTRLIRWFAAKYGVNMDEAENADLGSYGTFNDFFTRALKADARPLSDATFVCPVDGAISQFGEIDDHHILQAKGHRFTSAFARARPSSSGASYPPPAATG